MRRNTISLALLGLLIIMTVSCQSSSSLIRTPTPEPISDALMDWWTLWLDRPACTLPCWHNITPGKTSKAEAVEILENTQGITITYQGTYGVDWKFSQTGGGAIYESDDGIVSSIWVGDTNETGLSLEKIVDVYEAPSFVKPHDCREGMCASVLVYPGLGMFLDVFVKNNGNSSDPQIEILPNTIVDRAYFIEIGMENFNKIPDFQDYDLLMKWKGYGEYP